MTTKTAILAMRVAVFYFFDHTSQCVRVLYNRKEPTQEQGRLLCFFAD